MTLYIHFIKVEDQIKINFIFGELNESFYSPTCYLEDIANFLLCVPTSSFNWNERLSLSIDIKQLIN